MNEPLSYFSLPEQLSSPLFGSFTWFSLSLALGFLVSFFYLKFELKAAHNKISQENFISIFFWMSLGALLGARLFATLIFDPSYFYLENPIYIFWPINAQGHFTGLSGFNFFGGMAGAIVSLLILSRKKRFDLIALLDAMVIVIPLSYALGRIGNFLTSELWGLPSTSPWSIMFQNAPRFSLDSPEVKDFLGDKTVPEIIHGQVNLPRHPTQLYEAIFLGFLLWIGLLIFRKKANFRGQVFSVYLIAYGAVRFIIEFFKDQNPNIPSIYNGQLLYVSHFFCLATVLIGIILLWWFKKMAKQRPNLHDYNMREPLS